MKRFGDIIGHEKIIDYFRNAVKSGQIGHAYILEGEKGSGKKTLADAFAQALLCETKTEDGCGTCVSCMQVQSGNHPDVIHVRPAKTRYSVEEIRTLNGDIYIKPYSSAYKIYVIEDAGTMNDAAQNAFLKTIEEPPEYAVLLLLAENKGTFLQTILSRCVKLSLKPVPKEEIRDFLVREYGTTAGHADLAATFCGGNVGRAIWYATSDDFEEVREQVIHLLKFLDDMPFDEVLESVSTLAGRKDRVDEFLDLCMMWFRDVILYKATKNLNGIAFREEIGAISAQASTRSFETIGRVIDSFDKARLRLKANVSFDIAMELLILALKEK
ncbi:MAG: DNA polymerase III subunit delta' [Lachnospiraceae bacterium]|nr:DNA polymerase III subunit delta' [Lachnospiraceae bacterium]